MLNLCSIQDFVERIIIQRVVNFLLSVVMIPSYIFTYCLHVRHLSTSVSVICWVLYVKRSNRVHTSTLHSPVAGLAARARNSLWKCGSQKEVTLKFVPSLHPTALLTVTCAHGRSPFPQISIGFHRSRWMRSIGCQNWRDGEMGGARGQWVEGRATNQ